MSTSSTVRGRSDFVPVLAFVTVYVAIALGTLIAIVTLRDQPDLITDAVWVRGSIVAASSLLTLSFAIRAARGHARSFLRLRIITVVMAVAIVVIVALPGAFPVWMKLDQVGCLLALLPVVLLTNGSRLRSRFRGGLRAT